MGTTEKEMDEPSEEHIYCCGAITEVLKFGAGDLHGISARLLFLVIPGRTMAPVVFTSVVFFPHRIADQVSAIFSLG